MSKKIVMSSVHSNKNISIATAFNEFIRIKKLQNLSDDTIRSYEQVFKLFTKVVPEDMSTKDLTYNCILDFLEVTKENKPNITDKTLETYTRTLRAIFYYFMEENYTPMFKIKLPKCDVIPKEPFTAEEVKALMKKPDIKKCSFTNYRNWVIACFLLGSGVRRRTLINIKIKNIDFHDNFIRLQTVKNRKAYNIPLSKELSKILLEYLSIRKGDEDDFLFCNQFGEQMTENCVKLAMIRYSKDRGVTKNGIHVYRHTFAKYFVLGGGSLVELQEILGHSSIEMARHYVKMYSKDLIRDFEKRNPLDINSSIIEGRKAIKMR